MGTMAYLRFYTTGLLVAFAGAQIVHSYYRPLDDLEELVEKEFKKRKAEVNK